MWQYVRDQKHGTIKNQRAFLYTIARNIVIDHWRQKEKQATTDLEDVAYILADGNDVHAKTVLLNDIENLMKLLELLPGHHKEILTLRYTEELSFAEIARILNKSVIAVRVEAHRAMKKLKKLANSKTNL